MDWIVAGLFGILVLLLLKAVVTSQLGEDDGGP